MRALILAVAILLLSFPASAQTNRSTGLLFADRDQYLSIPPAPAPLTGPPPATVDLSAYGYFPEPGNQGNQESCVAWAVAYGLKSYQKNREFRLQNMPASFQFSPAFIYNQIKQNNCSGGSYITAALNVLETQGALPLDKFAYDEKECGKVPTDAQIQSAWEYRIARWMRVNVQSEAEMKAHIAKGFPIVIAMKVYQSFMDWKGGGVYTKTTSNAGAYKGGHAMLVVGYADQLKAFKVLNSWGNGWGDNGYAWIAYSTLQGMTMEGYVTVDIFMQHFVPVASAAPDPGSPRVGLPGSTSDRKETASAPVGAVRGGRPSAPDTVLTTDMLSRAVRSTTKPQVVFKTKGLDVVPFSVWLDLPLKVADTVDRVEYWFDHPSFINPKRSEKGSNIFLAKWSGYGCIPNARAKAFLKGGKIVEAPFDLCEAQRRF